MLRTYCILAEKIVPVQCTKEMLGFVIIDHQTILFKPFFGIHQKGLVSPSKSRFGPVVIRVVTKPETKHQTYLLYDDTKKVEKCLLGVVSGETTDNHQSILPNSGENNIMLSSSTILVHRGMVAKKIVLWESTVFYFNCFKLLTDTYSISKEESVKSVFCIVTLVKNSFCSQHLSIDTTFKQTIKMEKCWCRHLACLLKSLSFMYASPNSSRPIYSFDDSSYNYRHPSSCLV